MNIDEAIGLVISALKEGTAADYGYDFYPAGVAEKVAWEEAHRDRQVSAQLTNEYFPYFEEAGWVLCMRGVLRPGVNKRGGQSVQQGGYSLTLEGANRLQELDETTAYLYRSNSLIETFSSFSNRFGEAFVQRASEGVYCRDASAWLASCVMCGAAAESVLLAIAIEKTGDEEDVLRKYRGARGRSETLKIVTGGAKDYIRAALFDFSGIIGKWRDEAGHGVASPISPASADEALRQLLHMCQFVDREWEALTAS